MRRALLLAASLSAVLAVAGCDSLPSLPRIDLSGVFGGNHPAVQPASLDVVQREPDLTLHFRGLTLKDSNIDYGSNEITLHFNGSADPAVIADVQRSAPDWIAGTQTNGDAATIVASKDVDFSTALAADGFELTLKPRSAAPVAAPTEPVETDPLRGDTKETSTNDGIEGLQREDMRTAFGVDDQSTAAGSGL